MHEQFVGTMPVQEKHLIDVAALERYMREHVEGFQGSLSIEQFNDLVTLTFANTLEAYRRLPLMTRKACRKYLLRFRPIAIEPARQALDAVCPPPWQVWR